MVPSRLPSAQAVSSTLQVAEQPSPLAVLPSSHSSFSSAMVMPSPHLPGAQVPVKQAEVGPHRVLLATLTWAHPPGLLHESMVHALASSHDKVAGAQTPPAQTSGPVQALPSLHGALLAVWLQPVEGLQPSVVHRFTSSQFRAAPAVHTPPLHASDTVHTLPSASQLLPFMAAPLNTHRPVVVLHESLVHKLPSLQTVAAPEVHAPAEHLSPTVHALPSLHALALAANLQPATMSQLSLVHGLLSLHTTALPATQLVPLHASPTVQTEPSASHGAPLFWATYAHRPVLVAQVFLRQSVSPALLHATTVAGLTLHWYGRLLLSQKSVPLQKLPSSWPAQSAVTVHAQMFVPDLHDPPPQVSPTVQPLDTVGNTGLSQAGAQDFGLFRKILEAGGVPKPPTLDDLGFFAEHKLDYPDPLCGQDMCMHALLGIMGNMITGSTCTLVQIGLNTPLKIEEQARPPLDLVLAIDTSNSMQGEAIAYVQQGLQQMLDQLQPGDTVSLVAFANTATVLANGVALADKTQVEKAILQLKAGGQTDLFAGLFKAFALASDLHKPGREARVVLLSDGAATTGLQAPEKLVSMAASYAKLGIGLTTIGVGSDSVAKVLADLAEVGAGQFYFLDKPAGVKEVFTEEVKTFLIPVALDVHIAVKVGGGYVLKAVYGTHGWQGGSDGGVISIPTLFLAGRMSAGDPLPGTGEGRRGGGGAILIELVPLPGVQDKGVTELTLTWKHPRTGAVTTQNVSVVGALYPGAPIPDGGVFTSPTVEKGFVMLNVLTAFQMACALALDNDPGAAQGVLLALQPAVQKWLKGQAAPDPDIADDMKYVAMFIENLKKAAQQTPISKPPEPWPKD